MALAFDAQSFLNFGGSDSWTHTPVGTPRAVVVGIVQTTSNVDRITSVTYGGVPMARVLNGYASDNAGELGASYIYFLGTGILTGARTVAVGVTAATFDSKTGWCMTFTGAADTQVSTSGALAGDAANPSVTLGTPSGFTGFAVGALFTGHNAPVTAVVGSGYTKLLGTSAGGRDFGSQSACMQYGAKSGASVACGFTCAIEDVALTAAAIEEITAPSVVYPIHAVVAVGAVD